MSTSSIFLDYGPAIPSGSHCNECYADSIIFKPIYRLSWSDWESGVEFVGGKLECTNCGRKAVSRW